MLLIPPCLPGGQLGGLTASLELSWSGVGTEGWRGYFFVLGCVLGVCLVITGAAVFLIIFLTLGHFMGNNTVLDVLRREGYEVEHAPAGRPINK